MRNLSLQLVDRSGSSALELSCTDCGRLGAPARRVLHGDALHPVSYLWLRGKLACPCGEPGDRLMLRSSPAGMTPRLLAHWSWSDLAEAPPEL